MGRFIFYFASQAYFDERRGENGAFPLKGVKEYGDLAHKYNIPVTWLTNAEGLKRGKSVFEEFGLPKPNSDYTNIRPEDVSLDKILPDRRELDRVVFEALGLTKEEQLEVYRAVVSLVKNRLVKAGSV